MDMWWKEDIANVLGGIAITTPFMGVDLPSAEANSFQDGFAAALSAVAISLGIEFRPAHPHQVRLVSGQHRYIEAGR